MADLDPVSVLIHMYDVQHNRYDSFKEKLSLNISLAAGFMVIVSLVVPAVFPNLILFLKIEGQSNIFVLFWGLNIFVGCLSLASMVAIFVHMLWKTNRLLYPIKITEINFDFLDSVRSEKSDLAIETVLDDLKYSIERNTEQINSAYDSLLSMQREFSSFIVCGVIGMCVLLNIAAFVEVTKI